MQGEGIDAMATQGPAGHNEATGLVAVDMVTGAFQLCDQVRSGRGFPDFVKELGRRLADGVHDVHLASQPASPRATKKQLS